MVMGREYIFRKACRGRNRSSSPDVLERSDASLLGRKVGNVMMVVMMANAVSFIGQKLQVQRVQNVLMVVMGVGLLPLGSAHGCAPASGFFIALGLIILWLPPLRARITVPAPFDVADHVQ